MVCQRAPLAFPNKSKQIPDLGEIYACLISLRSCIPRPVTRELDVTVWAVWCTCDFPDIKREDNPFCFYCLLWS